MFQLKSFVDSRNPAALDKFREGIKNDIDELRAGDTEGLFSGKPDSYVFNAVMLVRDFAMESQDFEEHIVDGANDCGIDTWEYDDYLNTLYLVQNKYYGDDTGISSSQLDRSLYDAYSALERGAYARCEALQKVFDEHKDEDSFVVCHRFNVTRPGAASQSVQDAIVQFNNEHTPCRYAEFRDLCEMMDCYYDAPYTSRHRMQHRFFFNSRKERGCYTEHNSVLGEGDDKVRIKKISIEAPVLQMYELCENANAEGYNLYEENVREYLGVRGSVNKEIRATLLSESERAMFGSYNNGITIVCHSMELARQGLSINVDCPQVVNGCQTLSTIALVLSGVKNSEERRRMFENVTVSVTIFSMDGPTDRVREAVSNIVIARNSQNSIQKASLSVLRDSPALRLKEKLSEYGIALCVKQSDGNMLRSNVGSESLADYRARLISSGLAAKWGLLCEDDPTKLVVSDSKLLFNYDKVLQIVCMTDFPRFNPAVKSKLTMMDDPRTKAVTDILVNEMTPLDVANLILAYIKIEAVRVKREGKHRHKGWFPHPHHTLTGIVRFECDGDVSKIKDVVSCATDANRLMDIYGEVCDKEFEEYLENAGPGEDNYTKYNKSTSLNEKRFARYHDDAVRMYEMCEQARAEGAASASSKDSAKNLVPCGHCGAMVEQGTRFCSSCGKPLFEA